MLKGKRDVRCGRGDRGLGEALWEAEVCWVTEIWTTIVCFKESNTKYEEWGVFIRVDCIFARALCRQ